MPCTSSLDCSIYIIPCYSAVYMLLSASSVAFSKPLFLNSFYSPSLIIPSVVLHSFPYSLQSSFRDSVLSHCINANYSCSVSFRCYGYMIIYFFLIGERWNTFLLTFLIYKKKTHKWAWPEFHRWFCVKITLLSLGTRGMFLYSCLTAGWRTDKIRTANIPSQCYTMMQKKASALE